MSYATVDELRVYLEQVPLGAENDSRLQDVLDRATDTIDKRLAFSFAAYPVAATASDVRCHGNTEYLELPAHDQGTVASVYQVYSKATDWEATDEIDDYIELDDGRLWRGAGWGNGSWYRVTAKWGYGLAPDSVVQICLEVAVLLWHRRSSGSMAQGAEGGGAVIRQFALSRDQQERLDEVRADVLGIVVV